MELKAFFKKPLIYYTLVGFAAVVVAIVYYLMAVRPAVNEPREVSYNEFGSYRLNFEHAYPVIPPPVYPCKPFAYSYNLDLGTIRNMIRAGAYSVKISNGLISGRKVFILTPVNTSYAEIAGQQNYMCTDEKLCPIYCDEPLGSAASTVTVAAAKTYIAAYAALPLATRDDINGFLISRDAFDDLTRRPTTVNIRAYHMLEGGRRVLGLVATGSDGYNITNLVLMQDKSSLF